MKTYALALGIGLIMLALQVGLYVQSGKAEQGIFLGPDSYMRMVRVQEWRSGGGWYDTTIDRANAPHGADMHWTRPMDFLIASTAGILDWVMEKPDALKWAGFLVSPLLLVVFLLAAAWATKPFLDPFERWWLLLLCVFQLGIVMSFRIGRPDHHGLTVLLFILVLGCLYRMVVLPASSMGWAWALGLALATSLWVNMENLITVLYVVSTLGVYWVVSDRSDGISMRNSLVALLSFSIAIVLIDKPPSQWWAVEYDRLSIVHLTAFGFMAAASAGAARLQEYAPNGWVRVFYALITGTLAAGAMFWLYPDFYSPYANITTAEGWRWLANITEFQPLFNDKGEGWARLFLWGGSGLFGIPFLGWMIATQPEKRRWWVMAAGVLIYGGLMLYQIRWVHYAAVVMTIPSAVFAGRCLRSLGRCLYKPWNVIAKALLVVVILFGPILMGALLKSRIPKTPEDRASVPGADLSKLCGWLADQGGLGAEPKTILCDVYDGPEILWRTPHSVIATPYHRNDDAIAFTERILFSTDPEEVRIRLTERGVGLILIRRNAKERRWYSTKEDGHTTFYHKLDQGLAPAWLERVFIPLELTPHFALFRKGERP